MVGTVLMEGILDSFPIRLKVIYILPSSIHEVLLVPEKEGSDPAALSGTGERSEPYRGG